MDFKITNIEKHHKDDIYKLIEAINREDNLSYSLTDEWLDYVIENAGQGIFLAYHGDQLAGLGTAMINSVYKDQGSLNVVVAKEYRRKGLASLLYDEIYRFIKSQGVTIVECFVKERLREGVDFAKERGFKVAMYSWVMEMSLDSLDFAIEEKPALNFTRANKSHGLSYKEIIYDAFFDEVEENTLGELLKDPSIITYILEKDNKAIGLATAQVREELSLAYIYDIAILKDHRCQGLGSYLIKSSLKDLEKIGLSKASLLVTGKNKGALELYKKIGFREVDIDLIMVKEI